jgi:hypothetical protein
MPPARRAYLAAMTADQRGRLASESRRMIRKAWPHRHVSFRAPLVIRANITMLRDLVELAGVCGEQADDDRAVNER